MTLENTVKTKRKREPMSEQARKKIREGLKKSWTERRKRRVGIGC